MKEQITLENYFVKSKSQWTPCNTPEDYVINERINKEMGQVKRELIVRFNRSRNISQHIILRSHVRG